jgi:glycosyltransferase involved in cell wall biosynthesis
MGMTMRTFVVVAAYEEHEVIGDVLDELLALRPAVDVVVVDDGSRDATHQAVTSRPVHALRHPVNLGQGAALKTGIDYALACGAEIVVTFDGDGQMSAEDIPAVIEPVAAGSHDVVLGTRFATRRAEGMTAGRRALLVAARVFTRLTTRLPVNDAHNGFRAFSREALELMTLTQDRMAHASEILHEIARLDLRWTEVPVHIRYTDYSRGKGQSSLGAIDIVLDLINRSR